MSKTLDDWLQTISSLHPAEMDLSLDRVRQVADVLGVADFDCPVVLVAGTNGKGSTIRTIEQFALKHHRHVAAITSPHLLRFNERLRLDGLDVQDELLIEAFEAVEQARDTVALTYFEFTVLAQLMVCHELDLDVLLVEVGLGGRLDATNILDADIAVVTSIDLDHMAQLGDTREAIGAEKSGIFRQNQVVVLADSQMPESVLQTAQDKQCCVYQLGHAYRASCHGSFMRFAAEAVDYKSLPLPRLHWQSTAAALMVAHCLFGDMDAKQVAQVIQSTELFGRLSTCDYQGLRVLLDVAHNPSSAQYLATCLHKRPCQGKTRVVCGMLQDKDVVSTVRAIASEVDAWYLCPLQTPRSAEPGTLAAAVSGTGQVPVMCDSVVDALKRACDDSQSHDRILVFGSFYTVAEAKAVLGMALPCAA